MDGFLGSRARFHVSVGALLLLAASPLRGQAPRAPMPDSVRGYIRDAMAAFRERSPHRAAVDWPALEDSVVAQASGAQTPAGTWLALSAALRRVDPHSFLMLPPDQVAALLSGMAAPARTPGSGVPSARSTQPAPRPAAPPSALAPDVTIAP